MSAKNEPFLPSDDVSVRLFTHFDELATFSISDWPENLPLPENGDVVRINGEVIRISHTEFSLGPEICLVDYYGVVIGSDFPV